MEYEFCPDCETYLVREILTTDNPNKQLSLKCNNCSYNKIIDIVKEPEYKCVFKQNYNINKSNIDQNSLKYLHNDPTLPHVDNIQCPNNDCITNKQIDNTELLTEEKVNLNNVLYLIKNENTLTYLYICCNCKHSWTNK